VVKLGLVNGSLPVLGHVPVHSCVETLLGGFFFNGYSGFLTASRKAD